MKKTSNVCIRLPDELLLHVDELVFERRKRKDGGRAATRTAVITDLVAKAATGCKIQENEP